MQIIRTLFQILFFKAKPSDVPFNINLTVIAFGLAWSSNILLASFQNVVNNQTLIPLLQIVVLGAMIALFLTINNKKSRIYQTLLSSYGVMVLINLALIVISLIGLQGTVFIFAIWSFAVQVYILKNALDTGIASAFFMTFAIQVMVIFSMAIFFPGFLEEFSAAIQAANA